MPHKKTTVSSKKEIQEESEKLELKILREEFSFMLVKGLTQNITLVNTVFSLSFIKSLQKEEEFLQKSLLSAGYFFITLLLFVPESRKILTELADHFLQYENVEFITIEEIEKRIKKIKSNFNLLEHSLTVSKIMQFLAVIKYIAETLTSKDPFLLTGVLISILSYVMLWQKSQAYIMRTKDYLDMEALLQEVKNRLPELTFKKYSLKEKSYHTWLIIDFEKFSKKSKSAPLIHVKDLKSHFKIVLLRQKNIKFIQNDEKEFALLGNENLSIEIFKKIMSQFENRIALHKECQGKLEKAEENHRKLKEKIGAGYRSNFSIDENDIPHLEFAFKTTNTLMCQVLVSKFKEFISEENLKVEDVSIILTVPHEFTEEQIQELERTYKENKNKTIFTPAPQTPSATPPKSKAPPPPKESSWLQPRSWFTGMYNWWNKPATTNAPAASSPPTPTWFDGALTAEHHEITKLSDNTYVFFNEESIYEQLDKLKRIDLFEIFKATATRGKFSEYWKAYRPLKGGVSIPGTHRINNQDYDLAFSHELTSDTDLVIFTYTQKSDNGPAILYVPAIVDKSLHAQACPGHLNPPDWNLVNAMHEQKTTTSQFGST